MVDPIDITENAPMRFYLIPDYSPTESKVVFIDVDHILADGVGFWNMFIN